MKEVYIYTDGACTGNPGKGGYGAVLIYNGNEKQISEGFRLTTNNRMELLGPIRALSMLKEKCAVTIYSDSKYLTDAINKGWLESWIKNNWRKADKKKVLNVDLWMELDALLKKHDVKLEWVKGHAGNKYNEICDALAVDAYTNNPTSVDTAYEKEVESI